jgi:hypothetical protein
VAEVRKAQISSWKLSTIGMIRLFAGALVGSCSMDAVLMDLVAGAQQLKVTDARFICRRTHRGMLSDWQSLVGPSRSQYSKDVFKTCCSIHRPLSESSSRTAGCRTGMGWHGWLALGPPPSLSAGDCVAARVEPARACLLRTALTGALHARTHLSRDGFCPPHPHV